jgi:peptidoglycan/LPS O-acetylase OafA/YrhL
MTSYRPDIEGLRAIAVLAVLAFHLDPGFLPGGFQGVDVFFVVSGYVITKLIRSSGTDFTFRGFYVRRFWRLFPALCVTVGATLLAAYPIYSAIDYTTLGWSGLATLFGVSNFFFLGQIDYLNDNTLVHPLLHTWSLGVEEQFYLFWPFAVVVLARRIALGWLIAFTLAASFAFNLAMVGIDGQFAFYMARHRPAFSSSPRVRRH